MRKNLILVYASWTVLYIGLILIFRFLPQSGTVGVLAMLFGLIYFLFPGWLINRFLKIQESSVVGQILITFTLSLGFYLLLGLIAILSGLTINGLMYLTVGLTFFLFIAGFIYDYKTKCDYKIKQKPDTTWLLLPIPILIGIAILLFVDSSGANYNGDPYFHLAIVRKAVDGSRLTLENLLYSKSAQNNPAYLLPAWHVNVAAISKFLQIDIVEAWSKINLSLVPIAIFALYFLIRKIFTNQLVVMGTFLVSLFFLFFPGLGYIFERLMVPDTFSQYILIPLVFAFSLVYIFEKNRKMIWLLVILIFGLIDIHAIHFFYFLFTLIAFAIIYSIATLMKEKEILRRVYELVVLNLILVVTLGIVYELKNGAVLNSLHSFWNAPVGKISYPTFGSFPAVYKVGLVLLPLTLLFAKNRRTLLILSSFLLIPLIYWTPLRDISIRLFSFIFTDRLLVNAGWYYLVIGSLFSAIFVLLESLAKRNKKLLIILSWVFAALVLIIESLFHTFSNFIYNLFYAKAISEQGFSWAWPIFILGILISLCFLIWQKVSRKNWLKVDQGAENFYALAFLFATLIIFYPTVFKADFPVLKLRIFSASQISQVSASAKDLGTAPSYTEFINQSIPAKSTILANPAISKILPIWIDDYMVYYPGSAWSQTFGLLFEGNLSNQAVSDILENPKYKINYIIVSPNDKIQSYFKNSSYQKIYSGEVIIYKVIK